MQPGSGLHVYKDYFDRLQTPTAQHRMELVSAVDIVGNGDPRPGADLDSSWIRNAAIRSLSSSSRNDRNSRRSLGAMDDRLLT